jgi:hypothetical protein
MKVCIFILLAISLFGFGGCRSNPVNSSSSEILVSAADKDSAEPAIAADSAGNLYVLYVEHGTGKSADVFLQKFNNDAAPVGEKVRVNPQAGQATAWRGDPPTIKVASDGTIYVGWTARVQAAEGSANDLYLSVSRDGGKSFDAPVKVNDDKIPASHGMHSLEIDKTGRIFFAWLDERYLRDEKQPPPKPMPMNQPANNSGETKQQHAEPNAEVYFAVSDDNGKSFSANQRIAENVCPCCKVSMTTAPDGRLYVAWRQVLEGDFRHIAVSSSVDGGNNFAPFTIVSNDQWQIAACPVSGAAMAVDTNNTLRIIWYTGGSAGAPGLYGAESKDGGKSFSPRALISDQNAGGTPVLLTVGGDKYRAVFTAVDKSINLSAAQKGSFDFSAQQKINDADLPDAAVTGDKVFIAFIKTVSEKRKVFLSKQQ